MSRILFCKLSVTNENHSIEPDYALIELTEQKVTELRSFSERAKALRMEIGDQFWGMMIESDWPTFVTESEMERTNLPVLDGNYIVEVPLEHSMRMADFSTRAFYYYFFYDGEIGLRIIERHSEQEIQGQVCLNLETLLSKPVPLGVS